MTNTRGLDNFFHYYNNDWSKRKENVWKSFTYWACFCDWVSEWHLDIDELDFEYDIDQSILYESGCKEEWLDYLDGKIKIELVDYSLISELVDTKIEEAQQEQLDELFDYLDDDAPYKTRDELENRVADLLEDYEYIDKSLWNVCDEYEEDRGIDYDEQLYDYLDWYSFVSKSEILWAIEEYYYPDEEWQKESASYWELAEYNNIADDYMNDRKIEFEEEEDNN